MRVLPIVLSQHLFTGSPMSIMSTNACKGLVNMVAGHPPAASRFKTEEPRHNGAALFLDIIFGINRLDIENWLWGNIHILIHYINQKRMVF